MEQATVKNEQAETARNQVIPISKETLDELVQALYEIEQRADEAARFGIKRCAAIRDCARAALAKVQS